MLNNSELANQCTRTVLFTCVVYANYGVYKRGAVPPKRTRDPSFLFQNLSSYLNINNQQAKFDKNLSAGSISVE